MLTVWVLASPRDEGLRYLDRVPTGVRVSVGLRVEDFAGPPPDVLLSPHCGDQTRGWVEEAMRAFFDNLGRFLRGEPLVGVVDKRRGY